MEAKTIKQESAAPDAPLKTFRIEDVSASIFARNRRVQGSEVTFYSVSLSRSYKDKDGVRRFVKSFDAEDLGALSTLIQQASGFIASRRGERGE